MVDDGRGGNRFARLRGAGSSGFRGVVVGSCREVIGLGWGFNVRA